MPKDPSPLSEAATQFEAELAIYVKLAERFIKAPLTSLKHLERANQILGELAECEQRLQHGGMQLSVALSAARTRQEALAGQVVEHAPTVQARNAQLKDLMLQLGQLATDVSAVNAKVAQQNGSAGEPSKADPAELSGSMLELSSRAEKLAADAHAAEFDELSQQAHALFQRLKAIGHKLQKAGGH